MTLSIQFLARDEATLLEKKLRRQIAEHPRPKLVLCYKSGNRDYSQAANSIAASMGEFTEVMLLFLFCISGDGWNAGTEENARWREYHEWRSSKGENRRLYETPGHQFSPAEAGDLSKVIELALHLGWDPLVAARPGRQILFLSHDDRMEIYRGFQRRALAERLIRLGYWYL